MRSLVRAWWSTGDNYTWTMDYLASRSLVWPARVLAGASSGILGLLSLALLMTPVAPDTTRGEFIVWGFAAIAVAWTLRWWLGPAPAQFTSSLFLASAAIGITLVCAQISKPVSALFCLQALTLGAAYASFFHGAKTLVLHQFWALASVGVLATNVAMGPAQVPAGIVMGAIAFFAVVAMPPFVHFGFWVLRSDAADSIIDPLTGLLNRRGLHGSIAQLVGSDDADTDVVVFAIDLDLFKEVNDTMGHWVGDEVLIRTARRVQSVVRGSALFARVGGEEFVVMDLMPRSNACAVADRVRLAIAAPADRAPVTASIGVACVAATEFAAERMWSSLLDALLVNADSALYEAKARGRNKVASNFTAPTIGVDSGLLTPPPIGREFGAVRHDHERRITRRVERRRGFDQHRRN